jgi:hypothetical protein
MTKLIFGDGRVAVQQGSIEGEGHCLTITDTGTPKPVGSTQAVYPPQIRQEDHDVVLVFKSLESARVLQDEINELCAVWSRDQSPKV